MRVWLWGVRGSVPVPGRSTERYGGNTSCVQVAAADGSQLVLDAGTGIRRLGMEMAGRCRRLDLLLTHLHLDHIQGLMFFPPCFRSDAEITIWGPASPEASLEDRIARYISAPLSPVEVRELPCSVAFRDGRPFSVLAFEIADQVIETDDRVDDIYLATQARVMNVGDLFGRCRKGVNHLCIERSEPRLQQVQPRRAFGMIGIDMTR